LGKEHQTPHPTCHSQWPVLLDFFNRISGWLIPARGVQNTIKNLAKKYMPKVFARKKIDKKYNADFLLSSWLLFPQKGTKRNKYI
jgi:hypothetical protein